MRAADMDRVITIQTNTPVQNDIGEPVDGWSDVADVPARIVPNRGNERFIAQQVVGKMVVTFRIRYRSDVTTLNRVLYDGREFDIHDVRELGRRDGLEIDASARSE